MTVAELIEILKTMPQALPVQINDESAGVLHENIEGFGIFEVAANPEYGDEAAVIITVNAW
jgi:hypothetical protein